MKKRLMGALLAAGTLAAGSVFAETHLMLDMGIKVPFAFADVVSKDSGTTSELGKVTKWDKVDDDFRFKLETDRRAGMEINFKPQIKQDGGVGECRLDTYFGWFKPTESLKIVAGTADERHYFKGSEERLLEKFGEITIIDCHADNELGVYYGLITDPLAARKWDKNFVWGHEAGSIRWDRSYGWSSSQLGNGVEGQGTNLQFIYSKGDRGLFASAVLVGNYAPFSTKTKTVEWTNSSWGKEDSDNSVSWVPEPQFRLGYGFRSGSVELIYKAPHFGNNVLAAFWQPRLMRDKLIGTVGVTFANDVADGSSKYNKRENEFMAFAFDARVQYKFSEKLRAKLFLNYSQVMPGDNNVTNDISKQFGESVYHYKNYKGETVGNKAENGFYVVSSIGYTLPYGTLNLDGGLYWRDLDNNDGFELGENFLTVKGSWTWWVVNGAGFSLGGSWYHHINTGDYGKKINGNKYDGIKDEITLGSYVIIKLGL
ncbi:hypothetical protein DYE50_00835 [Treponema ruminis]|uniref:Uncharacterized protein n=1 Tax=Treponema ruminis TaxID=744515 RepID=A0A7W8LN94_9SPIR|nr:hypothetical protein [Treponema ruminis]MBB5227359.1 hypothetical protein [Treponema ruminis]QSI01127.1 hypothetical protein DYE50_00835 [Treponema ruminis]